MEGEKCKSRKYKGKSLKNRKNILLKFRDCKDKKQSELRVLDNSQTEPQKMAVGTIHNISIQYKNRGIFEFVEVDPEERTNIWRIKVSLPLLEEISCVFVYPEEDRDNFKKLINSKLGEEIIDYIYEELNSHVSQDTIWDFLLEKIQEKPELMREEVKRKIKDYKEVDPNQIRGYCNATYETEIDKVLRRVESGNSNAEDELIKIIVEARTEEIKSEVRKAKKEKKPAKEILNLIKDSPKAFEVTLNIMNAIETEELNKFAPVANYGVDLLRFPKGLSARHGSGEEIKPIHGFTISQLRDFNVEEVFRIYREDLEALRVLHDYYLTYLSILYTASKDYATLPEIDRIKKDDSVATLRFMLEVLDLAFDVSIFSS